MIQDCDCVSRKEVLDIIASCCKDTEFYDTLVKRLNKVPCATTVSRSQSWVGMKVERYVNGCPIYSTYACSCCGIEHYGDEDTLTNFCPNCGADMRGKIFDSEEAD